MPKIYTQDDVTQQVATLEAARRAGKATGPYTEFELHLTRCNEASQTRKDRHCTAYTADRRAFNRAFRDARRVHGYGPTGD